MYGGVSIEIIRLSLTALTAFDFVFGMGQPSII